MNYEEYAEMTDCLNSYWTESCNSALRVKLGNVRDNTLTSISLTQDTPCLLCAGTASSGKTVFMEFLLTNLIRRFSPNRLEIVGITYDQTDLIGNDEYRFWRAKHVKYIRRPDEIDALIYALVDLREEILDRVNLVTQLGFKNVMEFNEHSEIPMPRRVIFLNEIVGIINDAPEDKRNLASSILANIFNKCGQAFCNIIMVTSSMTEDDIAMIGSRHYCVNLCLKAFAETSKAMLGTDLAITIPEGTGYGYIKKGDQYELLTIPMVPSEVINTTITDTIKCI